MCLIDATRTSAALRFAVGDEVECNTGDAWEPGEIAGFLYHDEYMPSGLVAPYQIRLKSDGGLIWAPVDVDQCIRAA